MKNGLMALGTFVFGTIASALFIMFIPQCSWISTIICVIFVFVEAIIMASFVEKQRNIKSINEYKEKQEQIHKLELEYYDFVRIVDETIQQIIPKVEKDIPVHIQKEDIGHHYLILFKKYYDWVCKKRITGNPDSFIIASCLMYSLICNCMIVTNDIKKYNDDVGQILRVINCKLAFDVALQIISEPTTFDKDENGKYIVKKCHPKKTIVVPEGLIQDDCLYNRIVRNIAKDCIENSNYHPIMQFANLLKLIYLNCD